MPCNLSETKHLTLLPLKIYKRVCKLNELTKETIVAKDLPAPSSPTVLLLPEKPFK